MCIDVYKKGLKSLFCNEDTVAKRNIVCYKVLEDTAVTTNDLKIAHVLTSPFFSMEGPHWEIGKTYHDENVGGMLAKWENSKFVGYTIGKGYFHAYKTLKDAKYLRKFITQSVIVKCIIPKGSQIAKGYFSTNGHYFRNYATKDIKIVKIIDRI